MILRSNELCDAGHVMSQRGVRTTRSAECVRGVFSEVAAAFNSVRSIPVAGPVQPMRFPENTKCGQEDAMIRWLWRKRRILIKPHAAKQTVKETVPSKCLFRDPWGCSTSLFFAESIPKILLSGCQRQVVRGAVLVSPSTWCLRRAVSRHANCRRWWVPCECDKHVHRKNRHRSHLGNCGNWKPRPRRMDETLISKDFGADA
jgi:hypothetical protein